MTSEIEPIGIHEGVELAEAVSYYLRRNAEARDLLAQSDRFPAFVDAAGTALMHYETMVIRSVEPVAGPGSNDRRVRLCPALAINGADTTEELAPILVTLLEGTEVRGGFIALIQRMNDSNAIASVYFFSDDSTASGCSSG